MPPEIRRVCEGTIELRAGGGSDDGDGRNFTGYAAVFNQPTQISGWEGTFNERMSKGAFKKTLRDREPVMQFDHGRDTRVGSVPIGHFTNIREDDHGLAVEARLFDNPVVEPVRQAIEAKAVRGMSIKFHVTKERWRDNAGKLVKPDELGQLLYEPGERGPLDREIREVRLLEAGPVVHPAYPGTSANVRSAEGEDERIERMAANYRETFEDEESEERDETETTETAEAEVVEEREEEAEVEETEESEERDETSETEETQVEDAQEGTARAGQSGDTEERAESPETNKSAQTQRKAGIKMPKTLDELIARQAEIEARLAELGEVESRSDEQDEEFDALADERTAVIDAQKRVKARLEVLKSLAESGSSEQGSNKAPEFHRDRSGEIYDLAEIRKMSYSGDDFLARVDDYSKRAVERAKFGAKDKAAAAEHVSELLETVDTEDRTLAKRLLLTGSEEYERAFTKVLRMGTDALCTAEERAALVRAASVPQALGTDGAGGYAVPFQLDPTVILTSAGVVNPIRQLARVEQIVGKEWQGVTSAGASVSRGAEGAEAPDSGFTLAQPTVRTNRVQGFVAFNIEIDLSWNALRSEITRLLVDAKGREEDSFITGDGSTGQQPGGVLGSLTGSAVTVATTDAFAVEDVYALEEALDPRWEPNASWLAHKTVYNKIRQFSPNGQGSNFWVTLGDGRPPRLLDYPDYRSSAMPSLSTGLTTGQTNKFMLFGDFSQFLIVDRIGMTVELIPNLLGSNGRPTGQRGVYAVWMNNSKILVPGAFKALANG
jgi:HK97 family phage major capsid protein/HK97 family phage prohead protease